MCKMDLNYILPFRFTKNLSPEKIQLNEFKEHASVTNLELNESVLMELMDLPTWLLLNRASCDYVDVRV